MVPPDTTAGPPGLTRRTSTSPSRSVTSHCGACNYVASPLTVALLASGVVLTFASLILGAR
jgi:hypothetical protein